MASKKHYIITSLTLGAIAAASAALIGVTNLITKDQIVKNEKNKINAGIAQIYGKNATISSDLELKGYQYSNHLYVVDNGENQESLALRTTGSNMYGKISLIAGFKLFTMPEGENETGPAALCSLCAAGAFCGGLFPPLGPEQHRRHPL